MIIFKSLQYFIIYSYNIRPFCTWESFAYSKHCHGIEIFGKLWTICSQNLCMVCSGLPRVQKTIRSGFVRALALPLYLLLAQHWNIFDRQGVLGPAQTSTCPQKSALSLTSPYALELMLVSYWRWKRWRKKEKSLIYQHNCITWNICCEFGTGYEENKLILGCARLGGGRTQRIL